jgi:hypothetical protein
MPKETKLLFFNYCPEDYLNGTLLMTLNEEFIYRRTIDLIYLTKDKLIDNDQTWLSISKNLININELDEIREKLLDTGKINIIDGLIKNDRCTKELSLARARVNNASKAGKVSAANRNKIKERIGKNVYTFSKEFIKWWDSIPKYSNKGSKLWAVQNWKTFNLDETADQVITWTKMYFDKHKDITYAYTPKKLLELGQDENFTDNTMKDYINDYTKGVK